MPARIRTPHARCALAAAALSLALAVAPASALAGGPGVTVFTKQSLQPLTLSGAQIAAAADVPPTTYTLRDSAGSPGTKIRLAGLSMRGLLQLAGVNPSSVRFLSVIRANGSLAVLKRADIAGPSPFPEGPALITDEGSSTRFFRPVRGAGGTNAADNIVSSDAGPLEITVDGGTLLAVRASASPKKVKPGTPVTFSARVRFPPAGAQITYHWDFGDGTTATGPRVTHSFDVEGDQQIQVAARATGGSTSACAQFCGGVDAVSVRVGNAKGAANAPDASSPGSGTGNPLAPGTGTGIGAGGPGGSGGGSTPGGTGPDVQAVLRRLARERAAQHARERAVVRRKHEAVRRAQAADRAIRRVSPAEVTRPSGLVVTGILLAGQGAVLTKQQLPPSPTERPAGSPKGVQAARGAPPDNPVRVPVAALLALLVVATGALRERRGVRLRTA
jgi:hypothetical protein